MNSEFPMSFPEEPKANSAQPERVLNETRESQESAQHRETQKKAPKKKPGTTLPLPRHVDSMLPPLSSMAQVRGKSVGRSAVDPYPMSEFTSEDDSEFTSSGRKNGKKIVISALVLTVAGLFVALVTGQISSSDVPVLANLRTQFGLNDRSTSDLPASLPSTSSASEGGVAASAATTVVESSAASNIASESSSATTSARTRTGFTVNADKPTTAADLNSDTQTQSSRPVSATRSVSTLDVEKAVALLLNQTAQNKELEEHLVEVLMQSSSPEKINPLLDALEKRHRDALDSLSSLRKKNSDKILQ